MTTVFVLLGEYDYEGDTLLGVYDSHQEAENAYATFCENRAHAFDSYHIVKVEVGAPAET